ncbi:MAG TPA: nucleotide-binding protein [Ignavibacteria bacterium]
MKKKFKGTSDDFVKAIKSLKQKGDFEEQSNSNIRFKTIDGGIILWYPTTGTISIQGNEIAKKRLEDLIDKIDFASLSLTETKDFEEAVAEQVAKVGRDTKIFLIHGHDTVAREQLELIIHKLGLDPYVLANTSGEGLTIIEALEREIGKEGEARFGIVLMTPDDFGYSKTEGPDKVQPRARQNVVLEMGMVMSRLGRKHVAILKKGHLEIPSDANGILYIPFNDHVKETVPKLADRLRASGFNIGADKVSKAVS